MRPNVHLLALVLPLLLAGGPAAGGPAGDPSDEQALPARVDAAQADTVLQEAEAPAGDPAEGRRLFNAIGCNGCHMVEGVGGMVGPDLTEVGARPSRAPDRWPTTEEYIRFSIQEPEAFIVPGYTNMMPVPEDLNLDDEMIEHLVQFLLGLEGEVEE